MSTRPVGRTRFLPVAAFGEHAAAAGRAGVDRLVFARGRTVNTRRADRRCVIAALPIAVLVASPARSRRWATRCSRRPRWRKVSARIFPARPISCCGCASFIRLRDSRRPFISSRYPSRYAITQRSVARTGGRSDSRARATLRGRTQPDPAGARWMQIAHLLLADLVWISLVLMSVELSRRRNRHDPLRQRA